MRNDSKKHSKISQVDFSEEQDEQTTYNRNAHNDNQRLPNPTLAEQEN